MQPRAAGAPPETGSSLPAAPRSGSFPRKSLLPPSIEQPRAARAPPKQPPPSFNRAAPRSGSSPRKSLLPPLIEQPRAAGAPQETGSSLLQSSSPAQRELPQKQVPPCSPAQRQPRPQKENSPSLNRAAPRSGSNPKEAFSLPSVKQPRAAEAPPIAASSSLLRSSSPAQQELPHLQPRPSPHCHQAAPRSGRSHRNRFLPAAPRSGSPPRKSILPPSIEQPRAAGAPPETASSLQQDETSKSTHLCKS